MSIRHWAEHPSRFGVELRKLNPPAPAHFNESRDLIAQLRFRPLTMKQQAEARAKRENAMIKREEEQVALDRLMAEKEGK